MWYICQNYQITIAISLSNIFGLLRFIMLLVECLILVSDGMWGSVLHSPIMSPKVRLASNSFSLFPFGVDGVDDSGECWSGVL